MKQFNIHADAYDLVRKKVTYPESLYLWIKSHCSNFDAALDIGCGNGVSTIRLKEYFRYIEGSDLGENLIGKAKANFPEIPFSAIPSEEYQSNQRFDLITSATSFYWMDRDKVLQKIADLLKPKGVFCAYKYDFPIIYGPLRDLIENELVTRWAKYRDPRLTRYDDSLEKIRASGRFENAARSVISNIIDLTPMEVALFFLSTSYVTAYQDHEGGPDYRNEFLGRVEDVVAQEQDSIVKANFDIHAFIAKKN